MSKEKDFVIVTDSAADISKDQLAKWGAEIIYLSLCFEDGKGFLENEIDGKEFYDKMRKGGCAKTSAINPQTFYTFFKGFLQQGKDVLYLGFSSGLSTTNNSACIASDELSTEFANQKVMVVDTLTVSAGLGLLVHYATIKKQQGLSIEEVANQVESIKNRINVWATVDELKYLARGGRISAASAMIGNTLNIKPIISTNSEGKLVSVAKQRGTNAAIKALADKYAELAQENEEVFISHADNIEGATKLAELIQEKTKKKVDLITDMGAVIGAHAGPGTCAVFFLGKENK